MRLTQRNVSALRWLAEQFGAPLTVVADLYRVGDRAARRNAERLGRPDLASRLTVAGQQWVVPTRAGLRFAGFDVEVWVLRAWKLGRVEMSGGSGCGWHPDAVWTSERATEQVAGSGTRVRHTDAQLDSPMAAASGSSGSCREKHLEYANISADIDLAIDEAWRFARPRTSGGSRSPG